MKKYAYGLISDKKITDVSNYEVYETELFHKYKKALQFLLYLFQKCILLHLHILYHNLVEVESSHHQNTYLHKDKS